MNHYQALTTLIFTHADNVMTEIHIKYLCDYSISSFSRYACLHNSHHYLKKSNSFQEISLIFGKIQRIINSYRATRILIFQEDEIP